MLIPRGSGWSGDRDNYDVAKGPRNLAHRVGSNCRPCTLIDKDVKNGPVIEIDPTTVNIDDLLK